MYHSKFHYSNVLESPNKDFTILIVEDDVEMQDYLASLLEVEYCLHFASNGKDAIQLLTKYPIDLVISDVSMPIMNGFELLKTLRQETGNFIPFLFLSALAEKSEVRKALVLGVDGYITKPFETEELTIRVSNLLTNTRKRIEAAIAATNSSPTAEEEILVSYKAKWLKELETLVQTDISNSNIKVPDLAFKMSLSERTFRNRIKKYTGFSPNEYMMEARMNKALQLLENGTFLTVAEVAYAVGLEYSSYFTRNFRERFGKSPSEYL
jgi:YesN/AraC family two-component response regulator